MPKPAKKIPTSVFGRTSRLLISGARIASKEVAGRLAQAMGEGGEAAMLATKIKQTQELVGTLAHLKGAAMKAGQLMSLEFSDLLPPEVVEILRTLHDSGTFLGFPEVRAILVTELGEAGFARLKDFSEAPIAAASIGQVHRAELDGKSVVVKIQFPGVADTIDSDLAVLRRAVAVYLQMQGKTIELEAVFAELARNLKQEADYLQEADNIERYRAALGGEHYAVPEVYRELTTRRVLTMSHEAGVKLGDWLRAGPGPKAVAHFSGLVLDLLLQEFFVHGMVQTDPNYGNFLYRPVDGRLVLLDFGAMNRYEPDLRERVRSLLIAALDGDDGRFVSLSQDYGYVDRRESAATLAQYCELMRLILVAFARDRQPFNFADESYIRAIREAVFKFVGMVKFSPPAKDLMFLNRKLGGMFHLLKDAKAAVDLHERMEQVRLVKI